MFAGLCSLVSRRVSVACVHEIDGGRPGWGIIKNHFTFTWGVMGVPAFFRWLSRKYPSIVVHCIEQKVSIAYFNYVTSLLQNVPVNRYL